MNVEQSKMETLEFDAMTANHSIRLPKDVPDGVTVHVALTWEPANAPQEDLKRLFASVTEGLSDAEIER